MWVDNNHDAKTDAGELRSLSSLGIVELDLTPTVSGQSQFDNLVGLVSSYKTADGHSLEMADVWFAKSVTPAAAHAAPAADLNLSDLLAAPSMDLVPADPALAQHAASAPVAAPSGPVSHTPLEHELAPYWLLI